MEVSLSFLLCFWLCFFRPDQLSSVVSCKFIQNGAPSMIHFIDPILCVDKLVGLGRLMKSLQSCILTLFHFLCNVLLLFNVLANLLHFELFCCSLND